MHASPALNARASRTHRLWTIVVAIVFAPAGGCGWLWTSADPYRDWELLGERCVSSPIGMQSATADLATGEPHELAGSHEFTVEEALLYTLDNHPRLRVREQEVEVARAALITAGILPNPQFVLDTDSPTSDPGATQLSSRVMFTIPTGGKRHLAEVAAQAGIDEARWAIDTEAHLLLAATVDAALEVLFLQELVSLQKETARMAQEAVELERVRIQSGAITPTEALGTEIDAAEIEFDRLNNESKLELARLTLSRAMGLRAPQQIRIRGTLHIVPIDSTPLDQLLAEAARARPDLVKAEAAIRKSRRALDHARATAIPDFDIGPRYQTEVGSLRDDDSAGVRFDAEVPLWDLKQGDVYEAGSLIRVNEALADEVHMTTLHDVAEAWLQIRPIEAALAQYDRMIVPLADRTERLLKDPETAQALDPIDLSDQLRKIAQIRQKRLELQYQHNLIRTKLELLLGRPLGQTGARIAEEVPAATPLTPKGPEVQLQQDGEPRRLRPTPTPGPADAAVPEGASREPAPVEQQARRWSAERVAKDESPREMTVLSHGFEAEPAAIGDALTPIADAADPAAILDASNWRPSAKNGGARFRR